MTEPAFPSPDEHIHEAVPRSVKLSRRMRPPDLEIKASMDTRQPLREVKSGRRESRLGFGRLFGRHRVVADVDAMRDARDGTAVKEPGTLTETIAGPPYDLQSAGMQSETHLVPSKDAKDSVIRPKTASVRSPAFAQPLKSPPGPNSKRRGSVATGNGNTWDPIPFFQAWPQSVRTATLPACVQADHLLKVHYKKETPPQINHPDLGDEMAMLVEMAKKRHRRNSSSLKLDWTAKTYVLVASGYLMQYACEGAHDRLPEKVVQLTKDSAAFASDVIPGRHWVLQVSSVFEDGPSTSQDTRSLFGKFGLRDKEKRQVSDILMVFENAEDMETWMTLLRREIELFGGKAPLTEVGTPRLDDESTRGSSPTSPTQRPVAKKDPSRFTRNDGLPEIRWDAAITFEGPELHLGAALTELLPDHTFDDKSTTNSIVSQDGRQLDGLRDSSNRYSFMSATRTIVTSDSSACNSPIRDSFGSGSQSSPLAEDVTPAADDPKDARLRPNAVDIEDRRQSYRTSNIFLDGNGGYPSHRQHSSLSAVQEPPNFSLPHVAARRRAASQTATEPVHIAFTTVARPPRRARRPPPPTLGFTRPLSIVADSPSPSRSEPQSPRKTDGSMHSTEAPDTPSIFTTWHGENAKPEYGLSSRASSRGSMRTSFQVSIHTSPRKYASMNSLRPTESNLWDDAPRFEHPFRASKRTISPDYRFSTAASDVPRSISSMDVHTGVMSPPRSRSPIQRAMAAQKRASMYNLSARSASPRQSVCVFTNNTAHRPTHSDHHEDLFDMHHIAMGPAPLPRHPRRDSMLSVPGHSRKGSDDSSRGSIQGSRQGSLLGNRRSMPQMPQLGLGLGGPSLPAGPPPAPPPNKALPPIPVGRSGNRSKQTRSGSIPARMRMPSVVSPGGHF